MKKILMIMTMILTFSTWTSSVYAQTRIALISQLKGSSFATDVAIQNYLQRKGYQVELLDQSVSPNSLKKQRSGDYLFNGGIQKSAIGLATTADSANDMGK